MDLQSSLKYRYKQRHGSSGYRLRFLHKEKGNKGQLFLLPWEELKRLKCKTEKNVFEKQHFTKFLENLSNL